MSARHPGTATGSAIQRVVTALAGSADPLLVISARCRSRRKARGKGDSKEERRRNSEAWRAHHGKAEAYAFRIFWARFRRRIFFLRHFQRCLPGFFQARELRFMSDTVLSGQARRLGG